MITIDNDIKLDYKDVLLVPRLSTKNSPNSRSEALVIDMHSVGSTNIWISPIFAANMDHIGTFEMVRALAKHKTMTALTKHYTNEELFEFYTKDPDSGFAIYSMGIGEEEIKKFKKFHEDTKCFSNKRPRIICVDVANAYTQQFLDIFKELRKESLSYFWMAGNVVTREGVRALAEVGVQIIKVGIGPGSACSTRRETGVGYPQFSAVLECAHEAKRLGKVICADGGIESPGDVVKALAAGAEFVMIGGQFAGHDEGYKPSELSQVNVTHVPFYGMASKKAQVIHNGGLADYRASEGKEFMIPRKGSIEGTICHYMGGLRSACLYQGVKSVTELSQDSKFVRVSRQMNEVFDGHQR